MDNIKTPEEIAKKDFVLIKSWASDFICRIVCGSGGDVTDHFLNLASNELTDKIQSFKSVERNASLDQIVRQQERIIELEKTIATANAKIVELEKENKVIVEVKADDLLRQAIRENYALEKELDAANKKAEKLVEALEFYADKNNYADCVPFLVCNDPNLDEPTRSADCGYTAEQALKEWRGEK